MNEVLELYRKKELPEDVEIKPLFMLDAGDLHKMSMFRTEAIKTCGYVVVTKKLCRALAKFIGGRKVLEIMCGLGALAKGLRTAGVEIRPTDNYTYATYVPGRVCDQQGTAWLDDIECIDAVEAVRKYGKNYDIILLSWSPYSNEVDCDILKAMREVNSNAIMIVITEDCGGCCNSDRFFDEAEELEIEEIEEINATAFRSHVGIHDRINVYK